ncbi:SRA-YDG [Kalmanozyma brasiliensis GHG001]|uniref:YDG domain-containing protein n=1 Tax=Kalmanozyma brasiliensis (strain GHG001) TaxID=1365824 RepID=V5E9W3_KALBG|nr:SRA-YDG [Kalmanozyma brasiliensis GHG001]EST07131.1 SRA-YDG [Kalmanozyma brasiliensis GHG001]
MVRHDIAVETVGDDYEAQRQANIKANLELMMSLGLYQGSTLLKPKPTPSPPKPKSKPAPKPASPGSDDEGPISRPRRITRSVSRVLDPPRRKSRGMKRALSDEGYISRKHTRADEAYDSDTFVVSDDDDDSSYRTHLRRTSSGPLNPSRAYRPEHTLQRHADRLGKRVYDPKTFGAIPGVPVGTWWGKRMECSTAAVHAPTVAGISGNEEVGCWSICLSGGYEDDIDLGTTFTYTGSGGRDLKGTKDNPKNLRTAPQSSDQRWEGKNASLKRSVQTGKPVRVVRGYKGGNQFCPAEGYVYCGLYRVERAWMERGASGFKVCRFEFRRLPGQDALPTFDHDEEELSEHETEVTPPTGVSSQIFTVDLTQSPSPAPSAASTRSTASRTSNPILVSQDSEFDRASYIIVSDTEDEADEVEETLLQLELPGASPTERVVRSSRRKSRVVRYTR